MERFFAWEPPDPAVARAPFPTVLPVSPEMVHALRRHSLLLCLLIVSFWHSTALAQALPESAVQKARDAKSLVEALAALTIGNPEPGRQLLLEVPDIALAGEHTSIRLTSKVPGTDLMAIFNERGVPYLLEVREFNAGQDQQLSAKVKLEKTGKIRAVVRAAGKFYQVSREVKVATPVTPGR